MSLLTSWFKSSKLNVEDVKLPDIENVAEQLAEVVETIKDDVEDVQETLKASDVVDEKLTTLLSENAALAATIAGLKAEVDSLKQSAVNESRRAALSDVVSEDKVAGLLSSVAALDDNAFGVVLNSLAENKNTKKELWAEVGQKATEAVPQDYASTVKAAAAKTINKRKI